MSRTLTGTVVSNKGDKTIVISIQTRKTNRIYKKQYSVTTKYMAHDEKNEANVGDVVTIVETRPISARKRFSLKTINTRAAIAENDRVENVTDVKDEE
ncbi:30S ribosomal protein S17 [bacterium]|nr:30S ribosomal protein S17 [bacterium]NBX98376.1 30S ribosomal protein S17 [bacterium]NDC93720.1 30S ribosomal protein S17 [bacterium]NDD82861.1 30S ribosomal protein S17 [bacterium]NDG28656.1 30S ribosomal protein S17 [bacterium]